MMKMTKRKQKEITKKRMLRCFLGFIFGNCHVLLMWMLTWYVPTEEINWLWVYIIIVTAWVATYGAVNTD